MERGADFAEGESDSDSDSFNKENPNQLFDSADSARHLPEESYKAIMKKNYLYTLVSYPTYYHLAGRRKGGGGRGEGKGRRWEGEGGRGKKGESDMHSFCFLFFVGIQVRKASHTEEVADLILYLSWCNPEFTRVTIP